MKDQIRKKLQYLVDSLDEAAYRKGYFHGYHAKLLNKDHDTAQIRAKLQAWTNDLTIETGAPGSLIEHEKISWTDISHDVLSEDGIILKILPALTYTDKNNETKKYNVYERELFRTLFFLSRNTGFVIINTQKLSELCNMSPGSIHNAKKTLSLKCDNTGYPLITIEKVSIKTETQGKVNISNSDKIIVNAI